MFYILTEGTCRVTLNGREEGDEREISQLQPGDYFGEIALMDLSNKRTANVISGESVSCLTLKRHEFNLLLKSLKIQLLERSALKKRSLPPGTQVKVVADAKALELSKKRRITGFSLYSQRDDLRIPSLLKLLSKFMVEALWNSLYGRMFREMLLDPTKAVAYGPLATAIMDRNQDRQRST